MDQKQDKTLQIEQVEPNEHFEYKGNVYIRENVGENAKIIITNGSLTICGNIAAGASITLLEEPTNQVAIRQGLWGSSFISIGGASTECSLIVKGNIGNNVNIKTTNASVTIEGDINSNARIKSTNGNIRAENIGNNVSLESMNGSIQVHNVGSSSLIDTMNGSINATEVSQNTRLKTMNGSVSVTSAHETASLETMNGSIYENGIKRKTRGSNQSVHSVISLGNMSFIGGSTRRVIFNGRDISHLLNGTTDDCNNNSESCEEPIRYQRK